MSTPNRTKPGSARSLASLAVLAIGLIAVQLAQPKEAAHAIPAYAGSTAQPAATSETAVLAGGCFWGVQGVYEHVKGVRRATSGYAGGIQQTAQYDIVGTGSTGHAESVQITFDPTQISYAQILQIFFSVVHDPTQLDRQDPDVGTQYRSAIFPLNADQARIAQEYVAQLNRARVYDAAIVTKIEPGKIFYPAEDYHQDFLVHNPSNPYIAYNDLPKVENLKRLFAALYRSDPVLAMTAQPRH